MARMKRSAPANPAGTTRAMYRSGTKAPWSTVSWLAVARIPRTSHVCLIEYPSLARGMKAWTIFGAAGSLVSIRAGPGKSRRA